MLLIEECRCLQISMKPNFKLLFENRNLSCLTRDIKLVYGLSNLKYVWTNRKLFGWWAEDDNGRGQLWAFSFRRHWHFKVGPKEPKRRYSIIEIAPFVSKNSNSKIQITTFSTFKCFVFPVTSKCSLKIVEKNPSRVSLGRRSIVYLGKLVKILNQSPCKLSFQKDIFDVIFWTCQMQVKKILRKGKNHGRHYQGRPCLITLRGLERILKLPWN